MRARLRQFYENLAASFWVLPALLVLGGVGAAELLVNSERWGLVPPRVIAGWLYSGGETGARTLLGAVAGSTIGVAGTVFSITIATLTLASSQMGPRLLSNFTRDRGNQATLGIYLGTFAYALIVLRSVRGADQGAFVPGLAISGAIALALLCVGMLVYFVDHVSNRINFDTVIHLVSRELDASLRQLTVTDEQPAPPDAAMWDKGAPIAECRSGYIQQLDEDAVTDWACAHDTAVRLDARVGDFVFPGAPIARISPPAAGGEDILRQAMVIGPHPTASGDIEYIVGQLVDIAVRALSPGINDPRTAIRVLNELGGALCGIVGRKLPNGVLMRDAKVRLQRNTTDYDGLCDAMFHTIRQSAAGSPSVLIHMTDVLKQVTQCETDPARLSQIRRHGRLVRDDGLRTIGNEADRKSLEERAREIFRA